MTKRRINSEATDKVHAYLRRRLGEAGPGSVDQMEKELGVWTGYLRDRRRSRVLDVSLLVAVCRVLGIRPGKFLDDALGESEYDDGLAREEIPQARWEAAQNARRRFLEEAGDD